MSPEQSRTDRGSDTDDEERTEARVLVPVGRVLESLDKHGVPELRQNSIRRELAGESSDENVQDSSKFTLTVWNEVGVSPSSCDSYEVPRSVSTGHELYESFGLYNSRATVYHVVGGPYDPDRSGSGTGGHGVVRVGNTDTRFRFDDGDEFVIRGEEGPEPETDTLEVIVWDDTQPRAIPSPKDVPDTVSTGREVYDVLGVDSSEHTVYYIASGSYGSRRGVYGLSELEDTDAPFVFDEYDEFVVCRRGE